MIPRILSLILCLCDWASGSKIIRSREPSANVPNNISDTGKPRTVAYYGNWDIYAPKPYFITDIPASNLTHIIYAFANVNSSTGQVYLSDTYADMEYLYPGDDPSAAGHNVYGNVKQLFLLKKKQRNLKSIISIGGGTYSSNFVPVLANNTLRQNFASSAVRIVSDLGFDGIDIDYEYVNDSIQAEQFVDLLNKTRLSLDDYATSINASNFSLSFAAPAGAQHYSVLGFSAMDKYLDFWNFMGYAYTGPWNTVSGHMANLYQSSTNALSTPVSSNTGIAYYISKGATPGKIILGCPLYGSSFNETKGPGTPFESVGTLGTYGEAGTWYYNFLPVPGFNATVTEIPEIGGSFSYDPIQEYMISFDTPNIAAVKAEYVMNMGLGGSMWWEVSMDQVGNSSLIGTTVNAYGGQNALDQSLNHLDYPNSIYDNLRKGFPDSTTNSTVPTPSSSTVNFLDLDGYLVAPRAQHYLVLHKVSPSCLRRYLLSDRAGIRFDVNSVPSMEPKRWVKLR